MDKIPAHSIVSSKIVDALFSETKSLLVLTDDSLNIVKTSLSAAFIFGEPVDYFPGKPFSRLLDSGSRRIVASIKEILKIDGEAFTTNLSVLDCSGTSVAFFCTIRYLVCDECDKRFILFFMRNPGTFERSSFKRVDAEYTLKRFLMGQADSVLLIGFKERAIIDCNAGAVSMFGYSRQELIGRSPQFLMVNQDDAIKHAKLSFADYARAGFYQSHMTCRRKDGLQFLTMATNIAIFDEKKELCFILAINRDISEKASQIEELVRINAEHRELSERARVILDKFQSGPRKPTLSELGFTRKQIQIASELISGDPIKAIAKNIGISEPGVKNHLTTIYRRAGVSSRVEFMKFVQDRHVRIE